MGNLTDVVFCSQLRKAGDLVEVNLEEDPEYPVAADYDEEELETLTAHDAHGTHVSLEDWEKSALQRQYTTPAGTVIVRHR